MTIDGQFLIIDNVPYVCSEGAVCRGALISPYDEIDGVARPGDKHTVWFTGSIPHRADGQSLELAMVAEKKVDIVAGRTVQCMLSNKPDPIGDMLANFYNKMTHYVRKLTTYAREIDPTASASESGHFHYRMPRSVFLYPNMAIAREGLDAYEKKLAGKKVAIIGLGGTGSYILDALAKTPADEILLFDGDIIEPHNAYRQPGALTYDQAHASIKKTDFHKAVYDVMRTGIVSRPVRVDEGNLHELDGCQFVFIAIDDGPSRGLLARYLVGRGIPFIDVGIGVEKVPETTSLIARARVTLVTPATAHLIDGLPTADDKQAAVYNNIQLVELNAMNAMLAIVRYKQYWAFYHDDVDAADIRYKASWSQLLCRQGSPSEN